MRKAKKIIWILDGILLMVLLSFGISYLIGNSNILLKDKTNKTAKEENATQIAAEGDQKKETVMPTQKPDRGPKKKTTICLGGDVMLKNYHQNAYDQSGASAVVSEDVQAIVKGADICMINQEFPLSDNGEKIGSKENTYRVGPKYVSFFQDIGVDIVTLANDHVLDYGTEALTDTCQALDEATIRYAGAGEDLNQAKEIQYMEVNGYKIAFIAANTISDSKAAEADSPSIMYIQDASQAKDVIGEAKKEADYVVVYLHWGKEEQTKPEKSQRDMAKALINAGANVIVGSHTHCLQGMEYYNNCPIIYGLGDFVFGQAEKRTALVTITLNDKGEAKVSLQPCFVKEGKTDLITKQSSVKSFQNYMESISYGVSVTSDGEACPK